MSDRPDNFVLRRQLWFKCVYTYRFAPIRVILLMEEKNVTRNLSPTVKYVWKVILCGLWIGQSFQEKHLKEFETFLRNEDYNCGRIVRDDPLALR